MFALEEKTTPNSEQRVNAAGNSFIHACVLKSRQILSFCKIDVNYTNV